MIREHLVTMACLHAALGHLSEASGATLAALAHAAEPATHAGIRDVVRALRADHRALAEILVDLYEAPPRHAPSTPSRLSVHRRRHP